MVYNVTILEYMYIFNATILLHNSVLWHILEENKKNNTTRMHQSEIMLLLFLHDNVAKVIGR